MSGFANEKFMRMKGKIGEVPVELLIDLGVTTSFISHKLAKDSWRKEEQNLCMKGSC